MPRPPLILCIALLLASPIQSVVSQESDSLKQYNRHTVKPTLKTVSGHIVAVQITSGDANHSSGMHIIIETENKYRMDVSLGPVTEVKKLLPNLRQGLTVLVSGFQTYDKPNNQLIAKTLTIDGKLTQLRTDERVPIWSSPQR